MALAKTNLNVEDDGLDGVVEDAICAASGDMRAAILGLVLGQHAIEAETVATTSAGYVRRRLRS